MDVRDAVATRFSCRAFLPIRVPEHTVREILTLAARSPSAGNVQSWRVHALAGERLEALKALLRPRMAEWPNGEGTEFPIFPHDIARSLSVTAFRGRGTDLSLDRRVTRG